jgi:outer membrane murein-binding lipoprotein Lpp
MTKYAELDGCQKLERMIKTARDNVKKHLKISTNVKTLDLKIDRLNLKIQKAKNHLEELLSTKALLEKQRSEAVGAVGACSTDGLIPFGDDEETKKEAPKKTTKKEAPKKEAPKKEAPKKTTKSK